MSAVPTKMTAFWYALPYGPASAFLTKRYDFTLETLENVYRVNVFQSIIEKTDFVKRFDEEISLVVST